MQNGKDIYDSWEIKSNNVAIKHCDKSFFEHKGSGVPHEIKWFFNDQGLKASEKKTIMFVYNGEEYEGVYRIDPHNRARIFWKSKLHTLFRFCIQEKSYGEWYAKYTRLDNDKYVVELSLEDNEASYIQKVYIPKKRINTNKENDNDNEDEEYDLDEFEDKMKNISFEDLKKLVEEYETTVLKKKTISVKQYKRNAYVSLYAKKRANGICQLCGKPAPFNGKNGEPYLESHHIVWVSHHGEDTIKNTVALCPNCHKKMHVVNNDKEVAYLKESNALFEGRRK